MLDAHYMLDDLNWLVQSGALIDLTPQDQVYSIIVLFTPALIIPCPRGALRSS